MIASRRDTYLVRTVWVISLAAAGLIGYSMVPSPVELPARETSTTETKVAAHAENRSRPAREERSSSSPPQLAPDAQIEDPVAMAVEPWPATGADLRAALTLSDPIERMATLADLLGRLESDAIEDALGTFTGLSSMWERRSERELLLYAWGELDGNAAIDYVLNAERIDRGWGRGRGRWGGGGRDWGQIRDSFSVLSGWVSTDADAAIAWVQDNGDGGESPFYIGVIAGLAKTDLNRATDLVGELPAGHVRGRAIDILVDGYMQQDVYAASDWAYSLPPGDLKNDVVGHTARRLASLDPQRYADWTLSPVLGDAQADAVASFARQWSRSDPVTAAEWATELADDELRIAGMSEVVESWGRRDPAAAAEWLNQFELGPEMDGLIQAYVDAVDRRDPETAITWALAISDEQRRTELVQNISEQWMRRDPEGAEAFFEVK